MLQLKMPVSTSQHHFMNLQKKANTLNLEKEKSDSHTEKYTHSHVLALKQQQLFMSVNETFIVFSLILCEVH